MRDLSQCVPRMFESVQYSLQLSAGERARLSLRDRLLLDYASRHPIFDSCCCSDSLILDLRSCVVQVGTPEAEGATELHCFTGLQIQYRPFQSLPRRRHKPCYGSITSLRASLLHGLR
jgi:hypothetical protein